MVPTVAEPVGRCPPWRPGEELSISLLLRQSTRLDLRQIRQVHGQLFRRHLHHDAVLITQLVSSCSAAGTMDYAARLFHSVPTPDLVLCNAMLKGYTLNSYPAAAALFFAGEVLRRGLPPDHYTFPYVLKACAAMADPKLGAQVHGSLVKTPGAGADIFVLNSLLDMYWKCGLSELARLVFRRIPQPNTTTSNIMISGFLGMDELDSARELFDGMPLRDVVSWNTLMSAYARAGEMELARKLFDEMPKRNIVSWNALISGYSQNGQVEEATSVFSQMLHSGVDPDSATMLNVLSALSGAEDDLEDELVDRVVALARSMNSVSVSTALLNLYAKMGRMEEARKVFEGIPEKDLVTWNAMIGGYSHNQRPAEAIELFRLMTQKGHPKPDGITMVSLIDACSQMGALDLGEWIHTFIRKNKIHLDVFLYTALVDMYAKCGDLVRARHLFDEMPRKDLPSWNAMINGMAAHGHAREALRAFQQMGSDGVAPNEITFIGLLSACAHGGLVGEGLELFHRMHRQYGVEPRIEHYGCVVDLLGRAGRLADARELVRSMPLQPDPALWGALLAASTFHRAVGVAEEAARELAALDPRHDGNYVLLSNAYASAGLWGDVEKVRAQMRANRVQKTPGWSSVEVAGAVHCFRSGDRTHSRTAEIYSAWDELVKEIRPMGYEPDTGALLRKLDAEEEKEEALYRHSEKLALCFALISSAGESSPIRIVKNLRICGDCHRAMELVSEVTGREIIVRDRRRFHHFRGGSCSCGGYW
ncbi:unnamed protein product [Spirodela intermedia]|uniref:DYW domain-containing protein n=1 Tax=Spirodela intermedia TaxID=51605 RepID=A0A7I8JXJ2_SPIIN|nr:unnamed protein product [Spirodela intermedia]